MDLSTNIILLGICSILFRFTFKQYVTLLFIQIFLSSKDEEDLKKKIVIIIVLLIWLAFIMFLIATMFKIFRNYSYN